MSRRGKLLVVAVKIIDVLMNSEYDVDENTHCKNCCKVCNSHDFYRERHRTKMPVTNLPVDVIKKK